MKMIVKCVVWDIIIDKQSLMLWNAVSNKGNQMPMMNSANNLNFSSELSLALWATNIKLFYSHFSSIWQASFVHTTKSTFTQKILLRKSICDFY